MSARQASRRVIPFPLESVLVSTCEKCSQICKDTELPALGVGSRSPGPHDVVCRGCELGVWVSVPDWLKYLGQVPQALRLSVHHAVGGDREEWGGWKPWQGGMSFPGLWWRLLVT